MRSLRLLILLLPVLLMLPLFDSCGYRGTTVRIESFDSIIEEVKRDNPDEDFSHLADAEEETDTDTAYEADTTAAPEDIAPEDTLTIPAGLSVKAVGRYADIFNDSNYRQYKFAEALGIEPIRNIRDAYHARRPIVAIESNQYYAIDRLTHSFPYLVPEAARLLETIGRSFNDSLRSRGISGYRIIVTSLLRTPHTVRRLRRINVNSTDSSTHQFGTTFDITYNRFNDSLASRAVPHHQLKELLATILLDQRNRGNCLVKYERKTPCFHITVTR